MLFGFPVGTVHTDKSLDVVGVVDLPVVVHGDVERVALCIGSPRPDVVDARAVGCNLVVVEIISLHGTGCVGSHYPTCAVDVYPLPSASRRSIPFSQVFAIVNFVPGRLMVRSSLAKV